MWVAQVPGRQVMFLAGMANDSSSEAEKAAARSAAAKKGAETRKRNAAAKAESQSNGSTGEGKSKMKPANEITAPSIGPNTVIEKEPPEERMARSNASDTDAMGLDKRREVVGGRYSASIVKQLTLYGIAVAVIAALAIGFILLAGKLDQAPDSYADEAPWTNSDTPPAQIQ